jgi:hypothetical protein
MKICSERRLLCSTYSVETRLQEVKADPTRLARASPLWAFRLRMTTNKFHHGMVLQEQRSGAELTYGSTDALDLQRMLLPRATCYHSWATFSVVQLNRSILHRILLTSHTIGRILLSLRQPLPILLLLMLLLLHWLLPFALVLLRLLPC